MRMLQCTIRVVAINNKALTLWTEYRRTHEWINTKPALIIEPKAKEEEKKLLARSEAFLLAVLHYRNAYRLAVIYYSYRYSFAQARDKYL